MIEIGKVVLPDGAECSVEIRGRETDKMAIVAKSANGFKRHFVPTTANAQSVVLNQYGDESSGIVAGEIFSDECPVPDGANEHTEVIEYENGGRVVIDASSNIVTISGFDIVINGNLIVNGTITDSVGLLTDHAHTGVMSGGSNTGGR